MPHETEILRQLIALARVNRLDAVEQLRSILRAEIEGDNGRVTEMAGYLLVVKQAEEKK